jgi:hypothetical protein
MDKCDERFIPLVKEARAKCDNDPKNYSLNTLDCQEEFVRDNRVPILSAMGYSKPYIFALDAYWYMNPPPKWYDY